MLNDVFFALSDPTRRAVLDKVRQEPLSVGKIAEGMTVSRPAVSQHLKILKEARLVTERKAGTRNIYSLDPSGLSALRDYFEDYWAVALNRFKDHIEEED